MATKFPTVTHTTTTTTKTTLQSLSINKKYQYTIQYKIQIFSYSSSLSLVFSPLFFANPYKRTTKKTITNSTKGTLFMYCGQIENQRKFKTPTNFNKYNREYIVNSVKKRKSL